MIDSLCDNVYQMIVKWNENTYCISEPQIVMICKPSFYYQLQSEVSDKIQYIKDDYQYQIPFLNIIGLKVPVVIKNDMPKNIEYTLMFRKEYERLEKEEMYKKFIAMFD
jgi:hypothetical protein